MRFGEPMWVCLGVPARGGGSLGVLRECSVCSTSGAELSCKCISSLVRVRSPLRCGETGEEKTPSTGSMPCSSRMPKSGSVMPVLLCMCQSPSCAALTCLGVRIPSHLSDIEVLVLRFSSPPRCDVVGSLAGRHPTRRPVFLVDLQLCDSGEKSAVCSMRVRDDCS